MDNAPGRATALPFERSDPPSICLIAVGIGREVYRERHPEPEPEPTSTSSYAPGETGHQCRSGGDNSECQDSGG
ncbi:hypothetical protein [Streptomyces sp. A5-4]|uniref:hypothetical protein n=1 Tax=Streptomyces sp. A5-4 TaxID=3384771 RepID=UPI003DA9C3A3